MRPIRGGRSGCGNAGAMETTDRFPPRLGHLAQTARFPHSHKPLVGIVYGKADQDTRHARTDGRAVARQRTVR